MQRTNDHVRQWHRLLRGRRVFLALAVLVYIVEAIVGLLLTSTAPGPPKVSDKLVPPPETWRAYLALKQSRGYGTLPGLDPFLRWWGRCVMVPGRCGFLDGSMVWSPDRRWRADGASEFSIALDASSIATSVPLPRESVGVVLQPDDQTEVWLWVRDKAASNPAFQLRP
jgi:hypothetical protein